MGPPSEDDGKVLGHDAWTYTRPASMGPPSEDDGKIGIGGCHCRHGVQLQWGRRPRTTERRRWPLTATPPRWLQWGRRPRTTERNRVASRARTPAACFNGAAVRGRRKARSANRGSWTGSKMLQWGRRPRTTESCPDSKSTVVVATASMGPPSEDDGKRTILRR